MKDCCLTTHIHAHTHTHIYIYTYTYVWLYTYECVCVCAYIWIYTYVSVCIYICMFVHLCGSVCIYIYIHAHTSIYVCAWLYNIISCKSCFLTCITITRKYVYFVKTQIPVFISFSLSLYCFICSNWLTSKHIKTIFSLITWKFP